MKYALSIRILHWLMAVCILGLIGSGWYMEDLPDDAPNKWTFYGLHKSFGVLVLLLLVLRIVVRLATMVPPLPETIKTLERLAAKAGHALLYVLMFAVPVSGYVMSDAGGHPVKLFGLAMPDLLEKNKTIGGMAHEIHELFPYVLLGVVVLHVAGALKHRFFDVPENDVLKRMW